VKEALERTPAACLLNDASTKSVTHAKAASLPGPAARRGSGGFRGDVGCGALGTVEAEILARPAWAVSASSIAIRRMEQPAAAGSVRGGGRSQGCPKPSPLPAAGPVNSEIAIEPMVADLTPPISTSF